MSDRTKHGDSLLRESAERLSSICSLRPFTPEEAEEAVNTLLAIPALLKNGERLREALTDEIAMGEQSAATLRELHRDWQNLAEEMTPDGDETLLQNMLYWLIEDVEPTQAKAALGV
jgi:hypothetical protein